MTSDMISNNILDSMKRVMLIGDSIRLGYEETARDGLDDVAEVIAPEENGGNSSNVLANLDKWLPREAPELVHVNCGLHDIKKEFGSPVSAVPIEEYEENLRKILTRLKRDIGIVVFALTTPVNEILHHENKPFDRFEADVVQYNAVAKRVAEELGVLTNDLFSVVQATGSDKILKADGVHFTGDGYAILGKAVADSVRGFLSET